MRQICGRFLLVSVINLAGCQTFLEVHQIPFRPTEFTWKSGEPVSTLVVLADPSCRQLKSKEYQDRVWWQISGSIKPPVQYGTVPAGANQQAAPRVIDPDCGPYTVTVTDASLRAESSTFSQKHITPLPM